MSRAHPSDITWLGDLKPCEVLYEFEGPCIFTTRTPAGVLLLAYLSEELEDAAQLVFVLASTSEQTIADLKAGTVSVLDALARGSLWRLTTTYERAPVALESVALTELPEHTLPASGTMLWSHLEPALHVKLSGDELTAGHLPPAALQQAAEIAAKVLKPLVEWSAREWRDPSGGRAPNWLRSLYSLPTQRLAYGSLEVSFAMPKVPSQQVLPAEEILKEAWRLLDNGLQWAADSDQEKPGADDGESLAILEALARLAPSGLVHSVAVSGRKLQAGKPVLLDQADSKRIRTGLTRLKTQRDVKLSVFTGHVRALNLDERDFTLRNTEHQGREVECVIEDERFVDLARDAFYEQLPVRVAARCEDGKTWIVLELEFLPSPEPESGQVD